MPVYICENPECRSVRESPAPHCPECGHAYVSTCRKCGRAIPSNIAERCWACGAVYRLPAPLPASLRPGQPSKPGKADGPEGQASDPD